MIGVSFFSSVGAAVGIALIGIPLYLAYVASISGRKKRRRRKRMSDGEESDYWFDHEEYQNRQNGNINMFDHFWLLGMRMAWFSVVKEVSKCNFYIA